MSTSIASIRRVAVRLEKSINGIISALSTRRPSQLWAVVAVSAGVAALTLGLLPGRC